MATVAIVVTVLLVIVCVVAVLVYAGKALHRTLLTEAYSQPEEAAGMTVEHLIAMVKRNQPRYLSWEQFALINSHTFRAFNPGCFMHEHTLYVVVRICNYTACNMKYSRPSSIVSVLVLVNTQTGDALVVDVSSPTFKSRQGLEDAKCIVHGDTLHMFCTYLTHDWLPRMCHLQARLGAVTKALSDGAEIHAFDVYPLHVTNMPVQIVEKNWMPLLLNDEIHLIYKLEPLTLLRLDAATHTCTKIHERRSGTFAWDIIRGTSNVIDYNGEKLCLGHYRNDDDFQYYHVFVRLSPKEDMHIIALSSMFKCRRGNRIEFANGLATDDRGNIIITYGAEDCNSNALVVNEAQMQGLLAANNTLMFLSE